MSNKFNRTYKMTIKKNILNKGAVKDTFVFTGQKLEIEYPLTLDLNVARSVDSSINTGVFTLYGLSEKTRAFLYKDVYDVDNYLEVILEAGYETGQSGTIFRGWLRHGYSFKESGATEYKTILDCWDGGVEIYMAYINKAFGVDVKKEPETILQTIVNTTPKSKIGALSPYLTFDKAPRGLSLIGKSIEKLNDYTGGNYFEDSGKYYIIDKERDVIKGDINYLDIDGGLLGSPIRSETALKIEMVFEPRIKVGQRIVIDSETSPQFNGTYKIMGLAHDGKISGAISGKLTTKLDLFIGAKSFRLVG